ncbi:MAG: excinuclease ABC subunit UvrC, partial [Alphaproteobacteria bacterium]|nr:excinuclease ABC subunit UvrC [Alphaproteobacteria bacterium]
MCQRQPITPGTPIVAKTAGKQQPGNSDTLETGPRIISEFVAGLPASPGVYRMLDEHGAAIYVGKARNLKARVSSYTRLEGNSVRIARMISVTRSMEFVTTGTESEALLLEANLIKRLRPRFNVLLRDDKSFPYILIATGHPAAEITKHRGTRRRPGKYFGPFASVVAVNRTINALQKAFLLRNCSDSFYQSRTRPCLQHQIKRCAAPCTGEIDLADYATLVANALDVLAGRSTKVQTELAAQMNKAAAGLDFERAALLRDRLSALAMIQGQGGMSAGNIAEADIFAIHHEAGQFCVQVFFFRAHQNWGNHAFYPRADKSLSEAEVLAPFLIQFYENRTPPAHVLLSHPIADPALAAEALSLRRGAKVHLKTPARGEKRQLVEHAAANAREALGRKLAETSSHKELLKGVARVFGLETPPRRIEVYDNSHIQGAHAVGAMIVSGPEGLSKKHYRTFNIKSADLAPGDDFGYMREVLTRRFKRLAKEGRLEADEDTDTLPDWPDLVVIDGGRGQLGAVRETLGQLDLPKTVTLVGIAKGEDRDAGRENFYLVGRPPFMLPARDPVLYFLQRLRDEAHRFAIGSHRARRSRQITSNPLDQIEGIGARRKRALLNHFGSAKAVSRAALADLTAIEGISGELARRIYDHFN